MRHNSQLVQGAARGHRSRLASAALIAAVAVQLPFLSGAHGAPGAFTSTGNMMIGRAHHATVRVAGGEVLATGGSGASGVLSSTEVYRQDTRSWRFGGSLATARERHTATVLADGRVLAVAGRSNSAPLASAEVYDPATQLWSSAGTLTTGPRSAHTATLLPDGRVLVAGGLSGQNVRFGNSCFCGELVELQSAEVWNPATGVFTAVAPMLSARDGHTATLLPDGKVLVAGGHGRASSEIYDPATNTWSSTTGSMSVARINHTASLLRDGSVLVAGGGQGGPCCTDTADRYNPTTGTWTPTAPMRVVRSDHSAAVLDAAICATGSAPSWCGKVLVAGGDSAGTAELFNPATGTWKAMGPLGTPRFDHTATLLKKGGKVLVAGGNGGAEIGLNTAEIFAPGTAG